VTLPRFERLWRIVLYFFAGVATALAVEDKHWGTAAVIIVLTLTILRMFDWD
jgi:hypothetical protein